MPVKFANYAYWYWNDKKKPVFVPNEKGYEIGYELKELVEKAVAFEPYYFHLRRGGHVAALHEHRENQHFARADLKNFFYSIGRNRVAHALYEVGIPKAGVLAKYSCVKNPLEGPPYCLPYGFVQSPILATLVLSRSALGNFLKEVEGEVTVSVYMDDIAISSDSSEKLHSVFEGLKAKIEEANFPINGAKTVSPTEMLELFNCELECDRTSVTEERRNAFNAQPRSADSNAAFVRYCESVERGNALPATA